MSKPVIKAMLIADQVYVDRSGKYIVAGIFDTINVRSESKEMPVFAGSPSLYLRFTPVEDTLQLVVYCHDKAGTEHFNLDLTFTNLTPNKISEVGIKLPLLPTDKERTLTLTVKHNNDELYAEEILIRHKKLESQS